MDSLTQMVLGAAVGEAVLGKKIGNRAIVWGGIAGTIPDLDVMANGFMSPIDALAFHRGFTHSIVFCILGAIILGWLVPKIYLYKEHKKVAMTLWAILISVMAGLILFVGGVTITKSIFAIVILVGLFALMLKRYNNPQYSTHIDASRNDWQRLFWWALITHTLLDCFTTYGTQIFLPFSDKRVAWDNISVADPLYTLPLIVFLLATMGFHYQQKTRKILIWAGIGISSCYMMFTILNKQHINRIFQSSLQKQNISYSRFMTTPTILNNVLWSGIAEGDSVYYFGQYSLFDSKKEFILHEVSKNHEWIQNDVDNDYTLKKLKWFSNGYYKVDTIGQNQLSWYDLRFGSFKLSPEDKEEFVFKFDIVKKNNEYQLKKQPTRPRDGDMGSMFTALWNRIKGI